MMLELDAEDSESLFVLNEALAQFADQQRQLTDGALVGAQAHPAGASDETRMRWAAIAEQIRDQLDASP